MDISRDPIVNVIYKGIKEPIVLCMENNYQRAALQLVFSAIDSLTKLCLPEGKNSSTRKDYAKWCEKYLLFESREKIKGIEWYAARCGLLHNYGIDSNLSRDGKARMLGYYSGEGPDIIYSPETNETMVMVRINALL